MTTTQGQPPTPPASTVGDPMILLTRRRWDWYFLPATLAATAIGAFSAAITDEVWRLAAPVPVVLMWSLARWNTPREGTPTRRLSADPDIVRLLWWGGFILVLVTLVGIVDSYVTGRCFFAPYEAYHMAVYGPIMVAFLIGTAILARRANRRRKAERSKRAEPAAKS